MTQAEFLRKLLGLADNAAVPGVHNAALSKLLARKGNWSQAHAVIAAADQVCYCEPWSQYALVT